MKELQGAIIIGSAFQAILGYSGLMSLILRYDLTIFQHTLFNIYCNSIFVNLLFNILLCNAGLMLSM